jgi:tRNA threonylcarbamoyladenosine biosynthesis protein TsaE
MPKKEAKNLQETAKIAQYFVKNLPKAKGSKAQVIGLSGDLGAGKTAFTKEVAKLLGVRGRVSSPTFVIMKKYPIKKSGFKYLFHLDAYRLKNHKELLHLGWDEIVAGKEHLVFIEWPENVKKAMPKSARNILIKHNEDGGRTFLIN